MLYMSSDVPVHHYTCSVYLFLFGITWTMTFRLIYWGTYTQIHPKIFLPVYLLASLLSNHKHLPVTTNTCVKPIDLPVHYPTCSFWLFHSDKTFVLTCPLTCFLNIRRFTLSSTNRFHLCVFFNWLYMHIYLSTHLLVCVPTEPPENECTC